METFFPTDTPDANTAIAFGDARVSHGELNALANGYVADLVERGVLPGARVGVWTLPTLETIVALYAHARFGYTSVPINSNIGDRELAHVVADASPVAVAIADSERTRLTAVPRLNVLGVRLRKEEATPVHPGARDACPLLILYTSGTTGPPKGAVLSARNAASNLDALRDAWNWIADDVVVHALPLFHVHGLVLGLFGPLRRGGALHFVPRFDEASIAHALSSERSLLFAVPTMYHRLSRVLETNADVRRALTRARLLISGSAGLAVREHARILDATGRRVLERYGLTETLINTSVRESDAPQPGRVGRALDGVELRLVSDAREFMNANDDTALGEVAVRGPNVFDGYLNQASATAQVLDDEGFFYTGDIATRDESGSLRIVGRKATDLIKTGGYKVGAGEVEAALLEHPAVKECAVVGVADEDLGERIEAFVVLEGESVAPTDRALMDHAVSLISAHKRPRRVHFVNALPRNAMGKIQKSQLKATDPK